MELTRSIWNHGFANRATSQTIRCLLLVLALAVMAPAQRDKVEDPTAVLNFFVIKDDNGKPVRSAAVIMHPVSAGGKQSRGGLELKTDADGKASFDGIPYGKLRVQVLATGFQTFGEDYDVDRAKLSFTIKLKRPQGQYSIYQDHPEEKRDDKTPPPDPNAKPQ
jgi:Carboxypeptidase regulatory-like domain